MMGASKLLVRFTVRTRPCCRSSFEDEMMIWFATGEDERARLMIALPCGGGEALRFDILKA